MRKNKNETIDQLELSRITNLLLEDLIAGNFVPESENETRNKIKKAMINYKIYFKNKKAEYSAYMPYAFEKCKKIFSEMSFDRLSAFNDFVIDYRLKESREYYANKKDYQYSNRYYDLRKENGYIPDFGGAKDSIRTRNDNLYELIFKSKKNDIVPLYFNGELKYLQIDELINFENEQYVSLRRKENNKLITEYYKYQKDNGYSDIEEKLIAVSDKTLIYVLDACKKEKANINK